MIIFAVLVALAAILLLPAWQWMSAMSAGIAFVVMVSVVRARRARALPVCDACGRQAAPVHRHRRLDGRPDPHHEDNPLVCSWCGASATGRR